MSDTEFIEWPEYQSAIRLLTRREHSVLELRNKLRKRGFVGIRIDRVIQFLIDKDLMSEQRFVEEYVYSRIEKGDGPLKLRRDLGNRGIDSSLIRDNLGQSIEYWIDRAQRVLAKSYRRRNTPIEIRSNHEETWRKKAAYLKSKGYSMEVIVRALRDK